MKQFLKISALLTVALMLVSSITACNGDSTEIETTTQLSETTTAYSNNYGIFVSAGYERETLQSNQILADWLAKCDDSEHSLIENYVIYSKRQSDDGVIYQYFVYRPECSGKSMEVTYDESSDENEFKIKLNYTESKDGGDCTIISVTYEANNDKSVSLSITDNGNDTLGIITTNAGDVDFSLLGLQYK